MDIRRTFILLISPPETSRTIQIKSDIAIHKGEEQMFCSHSFVKISNMAATTSFT